MTAPPKKVFVILSIFIGCAVAVSLVEMYAKYARWQVWSRIKTFDHCPVMTVPDQKLGWMNKPGKYTYSVTNDDQNIIHVTINPDHSRGKPLKNQSKPEIWFFGGSFTFGWGVTDDDAYPAKIIRRQPLLKIRNFGTPGYGTLQSLYLFRKLLNTAKTIPNLVVYGLVYTHMSRNLATNWWLKSCRRAEGNQAWASVPYVRINESNQLIFFSPEKYKRWPFSDYFASINFIQDRLGMIIDKRLMNQMIPVTVELIRQWKEEAEKIKAQFVVFYLSGGINDPKLFSEPLKKLQINFWDAGAIPYPAPETTVPGDGHPNHKIHQYWADYFLNSLNINVVESQ